MSAAQHLPADRTRHIPEDLEAVCENLLALSDDIWLSIDHNDNDAMVEGVHFKQGRDQPFGQRPAQYHPLTARSVRHPPRSLQLFLREDRGA